MRVPILDDHYYLDHFEKRKRKDIKSLTYAHTKGDYDEDPNKYHYISQPYFVGGFKYDSIKSLVEKCEKNGIEFDIMTESDHFPGKTIMFRWRKA